MKLGTLKDSGRDGRLAVVSRDNSRFALADHIAPTLQAALDDWDNLSPALEACFDALCAGQIESYTTNPSRFAAPLPRAYEWIDGSAYLNHVRLVRRARGAEPPETLETDPLIYQGGSGIFRGPTDDITLTDPAWGGDFEAELGVILGDVPAGTTASNAAAHVKLLVLLNDVTLRSLIPTELAKNFGFFCSKPATAFAPFAVTPDELGPAYRGGRVHLKVRTRHNQTVVGDVPAGPEMHFSFFDLVEHIAKTRSFTAGTVLGSGTVSTADRAEGVSCLAERRMIEIIDEGAAKTPFMAVGDRVEIEVLDEQGQSVFGAIDQRVAGLAAD